MKTLRYKRLSWINRLPAVLLALVLSLVAAPALAQAEELTLSIHRDFGFSSGGQIRGTFSLSVRGPADLRSVSYFIDGQPLGEVTAAPWTLRFQTGDYAFGPHELSATAVTAGGETMQATPRSFEFATGEQEMAGTKRVLLPVFGLVGGVMLVVLLIQTLVFRGTKRHPVALGTARRYGISGGGICPKCHRPFALHWWSLNLGLHKFERCDHCGKMSMVRRATADELARAEQAELSWGQPELPVSPQSTADHLRDELDESRYTQG